MSIAPHAPGFTVDDLETWPDALFAAAAEAAQRVEPREDALDLELDELSLWEIRDALHGTRVLVHHATRLLPYEPELIRQRGLRALDSSLVDEKLDAAHAHGHLTDEELDELRETRTLLDGTTGHRAGLVWAVSSIRPFLEHNPGVRPLLGTWGGEGIYWNHEHDQVGAKLRALGEPMIVSFTSNPEVDTTWYPDIEKSLVAASLGLADLGADIPIEHSIEPVDIVTIVPATYREV